MSADVAFFHAAFFDFAEDATFDADDVGESAVGGVCGDGVEKPSDGGHGGGEDDECAFLFCTCECFFEVGADVIAVFGGGAGAGGGAVEAEGGHVFLVEGSEQ